MRLGIVTVISLEFIVNPSLSIEISLVILSEVSKGTESNLFLKLNILTVISAPEFRGLGRFSVI